ncbi:phage holin family protein [Helicobacter cetorum]|uniref:Holin n=1 Tax=Helicobacter cetorum (strain ATCC BAA-540 / CCUG 52418 / MIT 99-5656) TaxID=1163745 RepID=I0EQL1_HELCM|nr:phage holin family protein [Helicobacter cetorum]AFI05230.1 hypothetical protein HCD_00990 [Helicobacter cetorum MIT 99-5656]
MKDAIVTGFEVSKIAPYILLGVVGVYVGVLYMLRSIRIEKFKSKKEKFFYIIQAVGSSMLSTWISYEIVTYFFHLPTSLSVAIAGGIGYLGAESISTLAIKLLEKRL